MLARVNHRPTQREIAAQVGVSVTTVSRILNPSELHPNRWASEHTVAAIQAAAASMGYRHNALAVSLRTSRTQTVGVLVPMVGDYVLASIYSGIDEVAREHGITALTASTLDEPAVRAERTFSMLDHLVDGMIFADAHLDEHFLDSIAEQGVAFTLVHRRHDRHASVSSDDLTAGRLAAQHFISLGRKRLAVITGRRFMSTGSDRTQGFIDAALEAGLEEPRIIEAGFDVDAGREAGLAILTTSPLPDAIFAIHDRAALGVISILGLHGVIIPDDVAVIGFYDTPVSLATDLTSISTPLHQMGRRSLELLLDRLNGEPIESEVFPTTLTVRGSTDPSHSVGMNLAASSANPLSGQWARLKRSPRPA
ncbi:MAG: LacI family transcriptional regulator [Propionibacteriaceae bacterium]|nr:LacI family transcriptional regulator [Propionibacteriaceae bacterium]